MPAAVVTGAARGLGLEIARLLLSRSMRVHLTDVDATAVEAAAAGLGAGAWASQLDVRDEEACRRAVEATTARTGGLDVWVNNAGLLVTGPVWEEDAATRERLFAVNTAGTVNGTLAALEPMRRAGRGHVINVVSLAGLGTPPGEALYTATKHAAISFTLGTLADLRAAGERGIELSALCPDGIWTPMLHDRLDDPAAAPSFSGRLLQPEQVAAKVGELLDRPRAVLAVPRSRGLVVRAFDAMPTPGQPDDPAVAGRRPAPTAPLGAAATPVASTPPSDAKPPHTVGLASLDLSRPAALGRGGWAPSTARAVSGSNREGPLVSEGAPP